MSNEIIDTTQQQSPQQVMTLVGQVARATKELVGNAVINLQGKKYIRVEGWQAIAAAHGCTVTAETVREEGTGIAAIATVKRLRDGAVLGQAEGYVGADEVWAKRPMYARRAMAQTRAISRACRNAFAHVVVAMNSDHGTGFETTPAEEVPEGGFSDRKTDTKGNVHAKMPEWSPEQKNEAGGYTTDILKLLENAYPVSADKPENREKPLKLLNEFRNSHKYDAPADVIDALAKWKNDLAETIVVEG